MSDKGPSKGKLANPSQEQRAGHKREELPKRVPLSNTGQIITNAQPISFFRGKAKQAMQLVGQVITDSGESTGLEGSSDLSILEKALGTSMEDLNLAASAVRAVRTNLTANADTIAEFILLTCTSKWRNFEKKIPDFSTKDSLIQQTLIEANEVSRKLSSQYARALQYSGPEPEWREFKEKLAKAEYAFKAYVAHFGSASTQQQTEASSKANTSVPSSEIKSAATGKTVIVTPNLEPTVPLSEAEQTILNIVELLGAFTDSPVQPETVIDQLTSTLNNVDFLKREKGRRELALAELEGHIIVLEDETRPKSKREYPKPFDRDTEEAKRQLAQKEIEVPLVTLGVIRDRVAKLYDALASIRQQLRSKETECDERETALGEVKADLAKALTEAEEARADLAAARRETLVAHLALDRALQLLPTQQPPAEVTDRQESSNSVDLTESSKLPTVKDEPVPWPPAQLCAAEEYQQEPTELLDNTAPDSVDIDQEPPTMPAPMKKEPEPSTDSGPRAAKRL